MTEKRKASLLSWGAGILSIIAFAVLYTAHREYPFLGDDFWYRTNLVTGEPVSSLGDILESQIWHYFNWGGRSIGHAILQLTLWAGENAADILNVLATLLLSFIICKAADSKGILFLFLSFSMILGLTPGNSALLWQAAVANYVYVSVIVFTFLLCFLRALRGQTNPPLSAVWMLPLGLAAGWSNENIGPTLWILTLIILILYAKANKKIPPFMITGNLACFIGSIAVIAAPGNFIRGAYSPETQYGLLWRIFLRCYAEARGLLFYLFPMLLIAAFVCFIGKSLLQIAVGRERLLLLSGALLSWGALILSPVTVDRAYFGTTLFLIAFTLSYLKDIIEKKKELQLPIFSIGCLIWLRAMFLLGEYICTCWGWIR